MPSTLFRNVDLQGFRVGPTGDSVIAFEDPVILFDEALGDSVSQISAEDYIKWVQRTLNRLYDVGLVTNGKISSKYRDALKRFNLDYLGRLYNDVDSKAQNVMIMLNEQNRAYMAWVQGLLLRTGASSELAQTGKKDKITTRYVKGFQAYQGLKDNGFIGAKTETALIRAGKEFPPGHAKRIPTNGRIDPQPKRSPAFTQKEAQVLADLIIGRRSRKAEVLADLWEALQAARKGIRGWIAAYFKGLKTEFSSSGPDTFKSYVGAAYAIMDRAHGRKRRLSRGSAGFQFGYSETRILLDKLDYNPVVGRELDKVYERIMLSPSGRKSLINTTIYRTLLRQSYPFPSLRVNNYVGVKGWCALSYPDINISNCGPMPS